MNEMLPQLLSELERFGRENDTSITERSHRMLNITRDTGEFLSVLVRAIRAKHILEIGTSNGYSTLWLADAARVIGGHVTTVELSPFKVNLAAQNFGRASLSSIITQVCDDAGNSLATALDESFDFIFLDSERSEYLRWWPHLKRVLRRGGILVVDNATSHADELVPFIKIVNADSSFSSCLVPVGNGEFLAVRSSH